MPARLVRRILPALLVTVALVTASCGADPAAEDGGPVRLLQPSVTNSALALPLWMPIDKGLFAANGIEIEYVDAPSSKSVDLFLAREFTFGWTLANMIPAVVAAGRPIDLYEVDIAKYAYGFYVQPDVESLADLAGKQVGISQFGGQPHQATLALFEAENFDPGQVAFVSAGSVSDIVTAMISGQVQAGSFGPPASIVAEERGMKKLFDLTTLPEGVPQTVVVGDPEWVAENHDAALRWMRAFLEGLWIIKTDPAAVDEVLVDRLKIDTATAEGRALLEASRQVVTATVRDPRMVGDFEAMIPELKETFPDKERVGDISIVRPDQHLVRELADAGFFEELEARYGPIPTGAQ